MSADGGTAPPKGSTSHCQTPSSTSWGVPALPANLNPSNRPVRTRMPGGVAGNVELKLHAPMPIAGWGVIRPCRRGCKIGPLVADDRATAEVVLSALLASVGGGEIFLDVPSLNRDAVALAQDLGLAPVFETARMYTGAIAPLRLERVFGITTFELG